MIKIGYQVMIITGDASGIGKATVKIFIDYGN